MTAVVKQSIAGVAPPATSEVTNMIVWPSIACFPLGRLLGRLFALGSADSAFRIGKLFMLPAIPIAMALYFKNVLPIFAQRYRLTNRRVMIQNGLSASDGQFVDLDRFDSIEVDVLPGQEWYHAGDLVFRGNGIEKLRLRGVSRPETFRQVCMKAHLSFVGVKKSHNG